MAKLKGGGKILAASKHNKRLIQAEQGADSHIDATRSHLNYSLDGLDTPQAIADNAKALIADAGITNLRKDAVLGIEVIFSLPPTTSINTLNFFIDCCEWLPIHFGGVVLSFDVHHDEAAPHAHVLILPLIAGAMNGGKLVGNRARLRGLQDSFHMLVARKYGLTKSMRKLAGEAKSKTAQAVLDVLKSDPFMKSVAFQLFREYVLKNPELFADFLNIEKATPSKKESSFVSIMTSKGKGSQVQSL